MSEEQLAKYAKLRIIFGDEFVKKFIEAKRTSLLSATIGDTKELVREAIAYIREHPEEPVYQKEGIAVALVEVPGNKDSFVRYIEKTGNYRLGCLIAGFWGSLFFELYEDLERLEPGEFYWVIMRGFRWQEFQGRRTWTANYVTHLHIDEVPVEAYSGGSKEEESE